MGSSQGLGNGKHFYCGVVTGFTFAMGSSQGLGSGSTLKCIGNTGRSVNGVVDGRAVL